MMIVNIRGCNGSGKSSIPQSMLDDPDQYVIEKPWNGKPLKIAMVFPNYGWVVMGHYLRPTGGMDTLPDNTVCMRKIFWYLLKHYPQYNLLMEGVLCCTVLNPYIKLFNEAMEKYPDRVVYVVSLLPPLQVCLDRIYKRNGGKPIKEADVEKKYNSTIRFIDKFRDAGINSVVWDNTVITNDKLIHQLEDKIKEWDEGNQQVEKLIKEDGFEVVGEVKSDWLDEDDFDLPF